MSDTRRFCIAFLVGMVLTRLAEVVHLVKPYDGMQPVAARFIASFVLGAVVVALTGKSTPSTEGQGE